MTKSAELEHRFVDVLPPTLEDGVLYVSIAFNTVVHHCCCGCGNRVVTPLSPAGWQLHYDGRSVTLYPSIGNHQYGCRSHYWIRQNRVVWSYECTRKEIDESRATTRQAEVALYGSVESDTQADGQSAPHSQAPTRSWWSRLIARWR